MLKLLLQAIKQTLIGIVYTDSYVAVCPSVYVVRNSQHVLKVILMGDVMTTIHVAYFDIMV